MLRHRVALAASRRIHQMAGHLNDGQENGTSSTSEWAGVSLKELPKSNVFTSSLPCDNAFPTPTDSHNAPREKLGPRQVKSAMYTYVRPAQVREPELLGVSPRAMKDLGLKSGEEKTEEFKATVSGNQILTWNEERQEGIYPWAQCYGGYQFGNWASQLGDGRAISLFETINPDTKARYEIQLKGAGKTPYSRFADGKAVLRSSIREYIVSEALNALRIPTTRALSLTLLPHEEVHRERIEPGAIVARFAQTWLRIGSFDLLRFRGERKMTRQLATFAAENVFGGWESLPARIDLEKIEENSLAAIRPKRNVQERELQGPEEIQENRFARFFREIVRRNAATVAAWQVYGFMNGVLNTDNTSILGLSIDFGPFAFLDNFDPSYTPNHDDFMLRYSYKNQPIMIWWNLVRLGEALGELMGAGDQCDDEIFVEKGVSEAFAPVLIKRAEAIIDRAGEEYKAVFMAQYKDLMTKRLGLKELKSDDFETLISGWLDLLESIELDFNQCFRKLSRINTTEIETEAQRKDVARQFFHHEGVIAIGETEDSAATKLGEWIGKWRERIMEDWGTGMTADTERQRAMKAINPNFVPKSWILDELIDRVENKGEREVLQRVLHMALNPFKDDWGWSKEEEQRFCGDVPKYSRAMQCSCSS